MDDNSINPTTSTTSTVAPKPVISSSTAQSGSGTTMAFSLTEFKKSIVDEILQGLSKSHLQGLAPNTSYLDQIPIRDDLSQGELNTQLSVAASNPSQFGEGGSSSGTSVSGEKRVSDTMSDMFPAKKKPLLDTSNVNIAMEILDNVVADMPDTEDLDKPIHEALGKRIMKQFFEDSQKSEIRTQLCKDYKLPENCSKLRVPKLKQGIRDLKSYTDSIRKQERKLYSAQ